MKKIISLILPVLLSTGYFIFLLTPLQRGDNTLPPLGSFINPFNGFWQNVEKKIPFEQSKIQIRDLNNPVEIIYDRRLVPHIFAQSDIDLAYAEGYLHAQNRLWQMDISSRSAGGRLSEVFGDRTVENDRRMRRMGITKAAENLVVLWKECPSYPFLQAYVAGVNHYINHLGKKSTPIEFKLFNYQVEPWSELKTALVTMSMNLVLCARAWDMQASMARESMGDSLYHLLFPDWDPRQSPVIPIDIKWDFVADLGGQTYDTTSIGHFQEPYQNMHPAFVGSNNWAVSGARTKSGHPILCNDPHLNLTLPSIWYEMHVCTDEINAYGVSIPGIPHITIGFNEKIAWGMTNVGQDVLDFYQIEWENDTKDNYLIDGRPQSPEKRIECVEVKGGTSICDTIIYTYWGPIVNEETSAIAMHWLPNEHMSDCAINTFLNLSEGENFSDYWDALRSFESPPQNFVFASQEGDIAMKVQGKFPVRQKNQGKFIQSGASTSNAWRGFIPYEQTPFVKNPLRGFVSSANQHSTDPSYPYPYHGDFQHYRSRTLNSALDSMHSIEVEDMMNLQKSTYNQMAADLLPLLISNMDSTPLSEDQRMLVSELSKWDYRYNGESPYPVFFEKWKESLYDLVWDEMRSEDQEGDYYRPRRWRTIELLEMDPQSPFFDLESTEEVESATDIVSMAFADAYESYREMGANLNWQQYKNVRILHLSRIPAFSVDSIPVGGAGTTLNAITTTHGPSWRMIVELSNPVQAWGIYPGGQSGNPGSHYYSHMIPDWQEGKYYPLLFVKSPGDLKDQQLHEMKLIP